ncbi:MAG: hypothetical protein ABI389_13580 [Rhodanobacter sp.]
MTWLESVELVGIEVDCEARLVAQSLIFGVHLYLLRRPRDTD